MAEVEFRLLGAMQLRVDDAPAKPGAAERGLLALLLLTPGRTVPASSLIDRLWSQSLLRQIWSPSSQVTLGGRRSPGC